MNKYVPFGIILLFLLSSLIPTISSYASEENRTIYVDDGGADYIKIHCKIENGSLSGFVNDSFFNPIEGALVSIKCGGLHMQNISDSNGFYYIDNVPIVDCYWNVSASKKGYETFWIEMSIDINSTYDFVLTPLGKTLYVGGSGPGNYSKIQDAIDDAGDGDTVFVYNGTYYEELEITKNNISLIGENRDNTVINGDGGGGGIYLYFANWIIISGFTIKYGRGLELEQSEYVTIENNNITDHYSRGLYIEDGSKYLKILNNSITNNGNIGINFDWRGTGYSTISGNIISGNKDAGLWLTISYTNKIYGNDFRNNGIAIHLGESDRNDIIGNNFISNEKHVDLSNSFSNIWLGNYWDNWPRFIPKPIFGRIGIYGFIPWINFDWHPAQEPYDISMPEV